VRIQNILERDISVKKKKKERRTSKTYKAKKKNKTRQQFDDKGEEIDEEDQFDDYNVYESDWTKYLYDLQQKINNKRNTRSHFTPSQLFNQFTNNSLFTRRDWEKRYRVNETKTKFEPMQDTLTKMSLLRNSNNRNASQINRMIKIKKRSERENKFHKWHLIKKGTRVYLTYSRLKGHPSETPLNVFEKKSTQTKSEWNTERPYIVDKIYNTNKTDTPKRFRLRNALTGVLRKTLYYREELLYSSGRALKK
jgi:hypothetical protein